MEREIRKNVFEGPLTKIKRAKKISSEKFEKLVSYSKGKLNIEFQPIDGFRDLYEVYILNRETGNFRSVGVRQLVA